MTNGSAFGVQLASDALPFHAFRFRSTRAIGISTPQMKMGGKAKSIRFALLVSLAFVAAAPHTARAQQHPSSQGTPTIAPSPVAPLTLDEAVRLALGQASAFQQSGFNERIAAEDVRQARAAFLPRVAAVPSIIATSPALGSFPAKHAAPAVVSSARTRSRNIRDSLTSPANSTSPDACARRSSAIMRCSKPRVSALASRGEILVLAVEDAYNAFALASLRRSAAEQNLQSAQEFERITSLLLSGGEVAPVDETRARLQTTTRRDELEQARTAEAAAADSLRVLVGYDFTQPIATTDLLTNMPQPGEVERFTAETIDKPTGVRAVRRRTTRRRAGHSPRPRRTPPASDVLD
ncbi:MAG: hypothetical protein WKF84_00725 [Pyrinomonadaceae bacterium]